MRRDKHLLLAIIGAFFSSQAPTLMVGPPSSSSYTFTVYFHFLDVQEPGTQAHVNIFQQIRP